MMQGYAHILKAKEPGKLMIFHNKLTLEKIDKISDLDQLYYSIGKLGPVFQNRSFQVLQKSGWLPVTPENTTSFQPVRH